MYGRVCGMHCSAKQLRYQFKGDGTILEEVNMTLNRIIDMFGKKVNVFRSNSLQKFVYHRCIIKNRNVEL